MLLRSRVSAIVLVFSIKIFEKRAAKYSILMGNKKTKFKGLSWRLYGLSLLTTLRTWLKRAQTCAPSRP
jgi:hypothetical protein